MKDVDKKVTKEVIRLGKHLTEITTVKDSGGKVLHELVRPVMHEFYFRDVVQVIVGATLLAIPIGFTEEVWKLGNTMPWLNIVLLVLISASFISLFVYYNYYRGEFSKNIFNFLKRVSTTYFVSVIVVGVLMTVILQVDWINALDLSIKKVLIVAFPASMSAVIADVVK